jgi:hypothetical protein
VLPAAQIELMPGIDPKRHLRGACRLDRVAADFGWRPRFTIGTGVADWAQRLRGAA